MSFLWINMLWMMLLIPLLILGYILVQRRRQQYALRYTSLSLVKEALGRGPGFRRHLPAILFFIGLTLMIAALARPVATVTLPSQQSIVVLAIDVSGSMRGEDFEPSRLEAAKSAARLFVEKHERGTLIGVVSFSESSAVVQAPTKDREAIYAAINRLTTQRGTAVGWGIQTSLDAILEQLGAKQSTPPDEPLISHPDQTLQSQHRDIYETTAIVLLSDGVSNRGPLPLEVAEQAANLGIRVYTVGIGSIEGAIIDFEGRLMRVRLDEELLRDIAENTEAEYFKAGSEAELLGIYENLGTQLILVPEQTELTAGFTGLASLFLLIGGIFSLLWFHRIP